MSSLATLIFKVLGKFVLVLILDYRADPAIPRYSFKLTITSDYGEYQRTREFADVGGSCKPNDETSLLRSNGSRQNRRL